LEELDRPGHGGRGLFHQTQLCLAIRTTRPRAGEFQHAETSMRATQRQAHVRVIRAPGASRIHETLLRADAEVDRSTLRIDGGHSVDEKLAQELVPVDDRRYGLDASSQLVE
jgi:hypothetical protein